MVTEDSLQIAPRTFPRVSLDSMYTWLVYPRDTAVVEKSVRKVEPFSPPLPARTWAEKQYQALPPPESLSSVKLSNVVLLSFLIVATLLAVLIRLRFWKYYNDYIKVLFHPRSVFRLWEVEGPHLLQFHIVADAVVLISLSAILWAGARVLFPELTNLFWGFPLFFAVFTVYYFYRYGLVYLGTHLLAQPAVGANLWRQYTYVHRLLWPLYLAVAYWALFGSQPLALIFSYFGLALYGVTTVYAIVRLCLTFFYFRHNLFFYFLYLCALEIAPPLAAIRWWYL